MCALVWKVNSLLGSTIPDGHSTSSAPASAGLDSRGGGLLGPRSMLQWRWR